MERRAVRAGQRGRRRRRPAPGRPARSTDADAWILGRLREVTAQVDALLEDFQFAKATEALYHFTWDELCDWYLELAKPQLAGGGTAEGTRAVLGHVLDVLVRLLHPVVAVPHRGALPGAHRGRDRGHRAVADGVGLPVDTAAARRIADLQTLVTDVRRFRTEQRVPDKRRVAARLVGLDEAGLGAHRGAIGALVRLDEPAAEFTPTATVEVALSGGTVVVELDTSGAIDVAAERSRLGRDLAAAQKELDQAAEEARQPGVRGQGARPRRRRHPRQAGQGGRGPGADHGAAGGASPT